MLKGFKEFIMRGNVLDLAVAVVIGAAFSAVVTALVTDILTPLIGAVVGQSDFAKLKFTINKSTFQYGDFINKVISFVLVAAAVYFFVVVPVKRMTELRSRRQAAGEPVEEATPVSDEVAVLTEIRDLLRSRD
jgi:large conductance mechanosensitive channel